MGPDVRDQGSLLCEWLFTQVTPVRFESLVDQSVAGEIPAQPECSVTDVTLKWFFAGVNAQVTIQTVLLFEAPVTHETLERAYSPARHPPKLLSLWTGVVAASVFVRSPPLQLNPHNTKLREQISAHVSCALFAPCNLRSHTAHCCCYVWTILRLGLHSVHSKRFSVTGRINSRDCSPSAASVFSSFWILCHTWRTGVGSLPCADVCAPLIALLVWRPSHIQHTGVARLFCIRSCAFRVNLSTRTFSDRTDTYEFEQ